MLIAGAGGFAKELIELVPAADRVNLHFFDDINMVDHLFDTYPVLHDITSVRDFFSKHGNRFAVGVGHSHARKKLYELITSCGGTAVTLISENAMVGNYQTKIGEGTNIMQGAIITNNIRIGRANLINLHCSIGHDSTTGDFCQLSPGVRISGNCSVGDMCDLGANAVLLPGVSVCSHTIIGAAALVTKNITEPGTYAGVPAKKIK